MKEREKASSGELNSIHAKDVNAVIDKGKGCLLTRKTKNYMAPKRNKQREKMNGPIVEWQE